MKLEEKEILGRVIESNPAIIDDLKGKVTPGQLARAIKFVWNERLRDEEFKMSIAYRVNKLDRESFKEVIREIPMLIVDYPNQYLELCQIAFYSEYKKSGNLNNLLPELKFQDYEMAKAALEADGRLYKHLAEDLKNMDEIKTLAVKQDCTVLQYIENQSDELVEMAVRSWPKSIRWANCPSLEKMQILAIELNLQAMPDKPVSDKVTDKFKELCIKNNYYDEVWCPKFNLSQEQIYSMLKERYDWVQSYFIYETLNHEYFEKALDEGYIKYEIQVAHLPLGAMLNSKLVCKILPQIYSDYELEKAFRSSSTEIITEAVRLKPEIIKYIPVYVQTYEMCKIAVKANPYNFEHVKVWDEELNDLFKKAWLNN